MLKQLRIKLILVYFAMALTGAAFGDVILLTKKLMKEAKQEAVQVEDDTGDQYIEPSTEPVEIMVEPGMKSSTKVMICLLLVSGVVAGVSIFFIVTRRIRKESQFNVTKPSTVNELENVVEYTLIKYGKQAFGAAGFVMLKSSELKQWIIMRSEPDSIFLGKRHVSLMGIERFHDKDKPLPDHAQIQELFQTEALFIGSNVRRTHFWIQHANPERERVASVDLTPCSLLDALKRAEEQGFSRLKGLPLGKWFVCQGKRFVD